MTAGAPWSVKGIDPKAREVAKHHARRSGMTLGEWLNRVILVDESLQSAAASYAAPEPAFGFAEPARPHPANEVAPPAADELGRVAYALDRLADRLEAAETRTGLAISGVEHSVRQALARIETAERESVAVASRVEGAVERVSGEQARFAERLRRFETEAAGPRSTEALRAIEQSMGRMAGQIYETDGRSREGLAAMESRLAEAEAKLGDPSRFLEDVVERLGDRLAGAEGRTAEALDALRRSLAELDGRLGAVEGGQSAYEGRFEALAQTLAQQVEAARLEFSGRLGAVDDGRVDRRFAELEAEVKAAEQRSSRAVQQIGRDVVAMAGAVNRRLQSAEERQAEAIAQAGGEMARVADAVEARLDRAERAQSEALERLSTELGKITDRLSERLLVSERRAAEAIDDVGEQVSRVTERIAQDQERAAQELANRLQESEARTAQLLQEAQSALRPAPAETLAEPPPEAPVEAAAPEAAVAPPAPQPVTFAPLPQEPAPRAIPAAAAFGPELFSRAEDVEADEDELELRDELPPFPPAQPERVAEFAPIPEPEDDLFDLDQPEPPADAVELSTREIIEQARASARGPAPEGRVEPIQAGARWRAATRPAMFGRALFGSWPKRAPSSTLQTAILVAGGAAFLSVGAAGVVLMQGPSASKLQEVAATPPPVTRAAVALAPPAPLNVATVAPKAADARPPAQLAGALQTAFINSAKGVEAGQAGALAKLKAIAEAGHPPAQFYLGKLYETGDHGVKQNLAEARRWTELAAQGGDAAAMHNLALFDFRGEGGPQDLASAARWFRAAAEAGVVDSQYNLGLLYQSGSGVARDPAQAYAWFSLAAAQGDAQARANAQRLQAQLTPKQRAVADQVIADVSSRGPSGA